MNKKVVLGLDLGIASVGWCLTDISQKEDNKFPIILHGVRLFETVDDSDDKLLNETRRKKRGQRRRNRRLFTRKRDFIKYLIDNNIIELEFDKNPKILVRNFIEKYINPFSKNLELKYKSVTNLPIGFHNLRKAAINEKYKLDKSELIVLLYFYLSLRGAFFDNPEDTKSKEMNKNEIEIFDKNESIKNAEFPIDKIIEFYKISGKIRSTINLKFGHQDYLKEIKQVFEKQNIDFMNYEKFAMEEKSFFSRIRNYSEGPGNEKSFSKYGLYANENGNPELIINEKGQKIYTKIFKTLWESKIGKCSYDKKLYRAPKNSFSAKVFDITNKLTDWKHKNEYISERLKRKILLSRFLNKDSKSAVEKILKEENIKFENLSEIAYNKDDNKINLPIINAYHSLTTIFKKHLINFENYLISNENDLSKLMSFYKQQSEKLFVPNEKGSYEINQNNNVLHIFDAISNILNKFSTIQDRIRILEGYFEFSNLKKDVKSSEIYSEIAKLREFSGTSSLSFGAYYKFIPNLISEGSKNYSTISYEEKALQNQKNNFSHSNLFEKTWVEDLIASPTVKRSLRQTMNLLKEIFKYSEKNNLEIEKIVVEVTRSSNNKHERKKIEGINKYRKEKYEELKKVYDLPNENTTLLKKLWLLRQQQGYDAYSLRKIEANDVINKPWNYDIDHIVPRSISFDDSFSNLVIVNKLDNAKKSNDLSAKQFIEKIYGIEKLKEAKENWGNWYLRNANGKAFNDKGKFIKLYTIDNLDEFDNSDFINRNLSDTSYITNALVNHLTFSNSKYKYSVVSVNGKQTSNLRNQIAFVGIKNNKETEREWKRPEGFKSINSNDFLIREEGKNDVKDDVLIKDRSFNGHHAEDAYFITIISQYFRSFKRIERLNVNYRKETRELDDLEKNNIKFKEKASFDNFLLINALDELNEKLNQMRFSRMVITKKNTQLFNETLYSGKYDKGKNTIKKVEKLNLLDNRTDKIKKIEEFFDEDKLKENELTKLHIFNHDKNLYETLKIIWNEVKIEIKNKNLNEKNYFKYFVNKKLQEGKISFNEWVPILDNDFKIIRKIRYIKFSSEEKETDEIIFSQSNFLKIDQRQNFSFHNTLYWVQIWVYKNQKDQYCFISIDARNSKFEKDEIKINYEKLKTQKEKLQIINEEPILKINKGDLFENEEKELFYIVGRDEKPQKLEIKYILGKKIKDQKQIQKPVKKYFPNWKKVNLTYMGEIFKK
ncbi:type II CRISPR RNA-guided endonuclease Cas9 [[Mycoplasma] mobile]|uniref:type II CRISPR RNA-guided endonuclease Cas9 n=1 Tax=[Mycoplasma] mobile TaxID=2118 RepID=UPI0002FC3807|nr:type II CRISPR RNA-guided endonuclease Cas9 [[Mycoplasma] mobile]